MGLGGAGSDVGAELVGLNDEVGFPVFRLFEEPHAATHTTVAAVTATIPSRAIRGINQISDHAFSRTGGYPLWRRTSPHRPGHRLPSRCERAVDAAPSLERGFGKVHDVVIDVLNDAPQRGQVGKHVFGEERCGRELALIESLILRRRRGR